MPEHPLLADGTALNFPASVPPTVTVPASSPALLIVTVVGEEVVVTGWLPKAIGLLGENSIGPTTAPAGEMPTTASTANRNVITGRRRLMASANDDVAALRPSRTAAPAAHDRQHSGQHERPEHGCSARDDRGHECDVRDRRSVGDRLDWIDGSDWRGGDDHRRRRGARVGGAGLRCVVCLWRRRSAVRRFARRRRRTAGGRGWGRRAGGRRRRGRGRRRRRRRGKRHGGAHACNGRDRAQRDPTHNLPVAHDSPATPGAGDRTDGLPLHEPSSPWVASRPSAKALRWR